MTLPAILLAVAQAAVPATPSPAATPPETIIHLKTSPFCEAFRDNVFHAVQGLRINDQVIDQGQSVLAKWAYDSVVDGSGADEGIPGLGGHQMVQGASTKMDEYQLGQIVGQAAHNLQRIDALLDDPNRFPKSPQNDADRDLLAIKTTLQNVADAQERSLNLLAGTYATSSLYDLLGRGNNTAGALNQASIADRQLQLGDPVFASPGYQTLPSTAVHAGGSLFASTPIGAIRRAVVVSQMITSGVESRVVGAVMPGLNRCL